MSNKNLDNKKKKLILLIVLAVIVVIAVASTVFAITGKNGNYTDTPVSDMNTTTQNSSYVAENEVSNNNIENTSITTETTQNSDETTTKPTTEKTTKKPKSRYAYITVQLPIGNSSNDVLEILIDGKTVAKQDVRVDGSSVTIATEEKYKGNIEVVVKLENYGTSASGTILAGDNSKTLVIPLNGLEEGFGKDE